MSDIKSENGGYTEEEKSKLTEVRKKMAEYLYTEIMPNIRSRIEIGWGKTTYGGGESVKQWRIIIYPDELFICCDFGADRVLPDGTFKEHPLFPNNMTEQCMLHWAEIKRRCLEEVEKCKAYKHTLDTFTV